VKRRLEKGRAWWEVEVLGSVLHVRSSTGDERKAMATPKLAEAEAEKRIWAKRALGYVEAGAVPPPAVKEAPTKREAAKEAPTRTVIERGAEDMAFTYLLTGKDLITVAGTLAASKQRVTQSFDTDDAAKEHLERVLRLRTRDGYRVIEKSLATEEDLKEPVTDDTTVEVRPSEQGLWQLTFKSGTDEVSAAACAFAISEMQRAAPRVVHVRCDLESPGVRWSEAILGKSFPSVERFAFDTEFQTVTRQSTNRLGDLSATFAALPNLRHAFFTGDFSIVGALASASLETLVIQGNPLSVQVMEALQRASLPKLESLSIGLASDAVSVCTDASVAYAISHSSARDVFVDGVRDLAAFLRALTERRLPESLRRLTLGGGSATNESALFDVLERKAAAFSDISLAIDVENLLTEEAELKIRALVPTLTDLEDAHDRLLPQSYLAWGEA
jgi:predicted DNA-binding WGR domain protein